jgi:hypothetical protein
LVSYLLLLATLAELELKVLEELVVNDSGQLAVVTERLQPFHAVLVHLQSVVLELEHVTNRMPDRVNILDG